MNTLPKWFPFVCIVLTELIMLGAGHEQWIKGRHDVASIIWLSMLPILILMLVLWWTDEAKNEYKETDYPKPRDDERISPITDRQTAKGKESIPL